MAVVGEHHPAFEEYCECIFELAEDDVDVIQARIAERLNVSRPAVSEMIRRLETEGLIDTGEGIKLTSDGQVLATKVVRRHRLAERFLTDVLGLSWADAHHEAGKWEHVMSEAVETAMDRLLGSPTTCPHGNPIPGSDYIEPEARPLSAIGVGDQFTVRRIPEELEFTPGLLEFLEASSLQPGHAGTITAAVARRHDDGRDRRPPRRRRGVRERPHPGQLGVTARAPRPITRRLVTTGPAVAVVARDPRLLGDHHRRARPPRSRPTRSSRPPCSRPSGTTHELLTQLAGETGAAERAPRRRRRASTRRWRGSRRCGP